MNSSKRYEQYCYNEFVDAFLKYAGTDFSREEALKIAKQKVRPSDFLKKGSPIAHKGP